MRLVQRRRQTCARRATASNTEAKLTKPRAARSARDGTPPGPTSTPSSPKGESAKQPQWLSALFLTSAIRSPAQVQGQRLGGQLLPQPGQSSSTVVLHHGPKDSLGVLQHHHVRYEGRTHSRSLLRENSSRPVSSRKIASLRRSESIRSNGQTMGCGLWGLMATERGCLFLAGFGFFPAVLMLLTWLCFFLFVLGSARLFY